MMVSFRFLSVSLCILMWNVTANVSKICNRFKNATIQRRGWSLQYLDELDTKQTWSKDVADLLRKAEGLQTTEGVFVVFV